MIDPILRDILEAAEKAFKASIVPVVSRPQNRQLHLEIYRAGFLQGTLYVPRDTSVDLGITRAAREEPRVRFINQWSDDGRICCSFAPLAIWGGPLGDWSKFRYCFGVALFGFAVEVYFGS